MSVTANKISIRNGSFELNSISFEIPKGNCAAITGTSGVGKTTLVEAICGLKPVVAGVLKIGERVVHEMPPWHRNVGLVPQEGVLFEHMTVQQHLEFPLRIRKWNRQKRESQVKRLLSLIELESLKDRKPNQLSGGQSQRLSIARAVSFEPELLCLDEPFSWLDREATEQIANFIIRISRELKSTILLVTHRREDIASMVDMEFTFRDGQLVKTTQTLN